jgi:nucleotide-binding universal stress UspA family protein
MAMQIERILCPVDLDGGSRRALDYGKALASQHGADLVVLHVISESGPASPSAENEVMARLRELVDAGTDGRDGVKVLCARGNIARQITEAALRTRADVIVMATRAEPVLERAPIGSVTLGVILSAPCPVFVISAFATTPRALLAHILCPLDFAAVDSALVEYAGALADASRARVTLVHIVDRHEELAAGADESGATERLERDARARLERAAGPLRAAGVDVGCLVDVGVASREILFTARATGADLIVMGAQSRSGLELRDLGSTTHDVMCEALCAVAVLPLRRSSRRAT